MVPLETLRCITCFDVNLWKNLWTENGNWAPIINAFYPILLDIIFLPLNWHNKPSSLLNMGLRKIILILFFYEKYIFFVFFVEIKSSRSTEVFIFMVWWKEVVGSLTNLTVLALMSSMKWSLASLTILTVWGLDLPYGLYDIITYHTQGRFNSFDSC